MTEAEWLAATDPTKMLEFLSGKASDRKLRLFACACCRRKWKYFTDNRCKQAVEISERFADDCDMVGDLDRACLHAMLAFNEWRAKQGSQGMLVYACSAAHALAQTRLHVVHIAAQVLGLPVNSARARAAEAQTQVQLLFDIFGNPFRPITLNSTWLTSTVLALANGIYEEKAFERMPILADALQDAGCDNEDVLSHCRQPGEHVKGCWLVDLLLNKQ
jgi:hypothetical protein